MTTETSSTPSSPQVCDWLVVDSGGFIKNAPLRDFAKEEVVTLREVVSEIRDKATKLRLQVLPYELKLKEPNAEDILHVTNFSKKTGDFSSLSATDIKVMALTYMLEKQLVGSVDHLNAEPKVKPTVNYYKPGESKSATGDQKGVSLAGFYKPAGFEEGDEAEASQTPAEGIVDQVKDISLNHDNEEDSCEEEEEEEGEEKVEDHMEEEGEDSIADDDEEGWITPHNVQSKKREMTGEMVDEEPKSVRVACLTTDFAMQNVLRQMGLNVISVNGLLIRECKTWILRCYACFQTTTLMEKKFCPRCGNQTLKRVSCTMNKDGSLQIHISTRRRLTGRGQKFSLPAPKGGKHAVNPVLTEDQACAQQRQTRLARQKTDALSEDYIAGNSPFALHDVTSRSAQLGITGKGAQTNLYWMRKNPNEVGRKTGNRKKKSNRA